MQDVVSQTATLILAGGRGERLTPLTRLRSKPALPFGDGHVIDFTLANCLRSGLTQPFIITQYQAAHLAQHVRRWRLRQSAPGADAKAAPVCVPAPARDYLGTADALLRNMQSLGVDAKYVLVLSADHIYEMDYRELLRFHAERDADATMGAVVCPSASSRQFGILEVDGTARVIGFEEKPVQPSELPGQPGKALANMGIYVFGKDVLLDALRRDARDAASGRDIGKNVLPRLVRSDALYAFRFEDRRTGSSRYWRDIGTIDSYYDASMEWLEGLPCAHRLAGSGSIIAEGARIHRNAEITDSILMPGVEVRAGARIHRAILDENVCVMPGARVGYEAVESHGFYRSANGIVVVPANSIVSAERGVYSWTKDARFPAASIA